LPIPLIHFLERQEGGGRDQDFRMLELHLKIRQNPQKRIHTADSRLSCEFKIGFNLLAGIRRLTSGLEYRRLQITQYKFNVHETWLLKSSSDKIGNRRRRGS
jgi:hypothetical protein